MTVTRCYRCGHDVTIIDGKWWTALFVGGTWQPSHDGVRCPRSDGRPEDDDHRTMVTYYDL